MNKTEVKKQIIVEKMADHLLAQGMKASSLRQLAAAAGMSDRMLLHYFVDKDELLTATLTLISARLVSMLDNARAEPLPFQILLPQLTVMLNDPHIRPYLRLWLELAALAASNEEPYSTIARQICDTFFNWIALALKVDQEEERLPMAALALATIEGFVLLDALNYDSQITLALKAIASAAKFRDVGTTYSQQQP